MSGQLSFDVWHRNPRLHDSRILSRRRHVMHLNDESLRHRHAIKCASGAALKVTCNYDTPRSQIVRNKGWRRVFAADVAAVWEMPWLKR
jgi:hypothetical protein